MNRPVLDRLALDRMLPSSGLLGDLEQLDDRPVKRTVFLARAGGPLSLWGHPQAGRTYAIGARWSPEWPVAFVIDRRVGEQVALWRQPSTPAEFADRVSKLGRFYNWAFLVPEVNDANFRDALLRTSYPLDHIYSRQRNPHGVGSGRPEHMGFETDRATRPKLVAALQDSVRGIGNPVIIRSPLVLDQCRDFVVKPDGTMGAANGPDDGCVWAAALAVYGLQFAPRPEPYVREGRIGFKAPGAAKKVINPNYAD